MREDKISWVKMDPTEDRRYVLVHITRSCAFCHRTTNDPIQYGEFKATEGIVAHYYCVLMSTMLMQDGMDHEGIYGFLAVDIRKILRDTRNTKCVYCKWPNATALCRWPGCKMQFHYTCGLENGAGAFFVDDYRSYCKQHNYNSRENKQRFITLRESERTIKCIYCQEDLRSQDDYYVTVCCRRCAMHVLCLKRHALAHGYFTKCPNCNNFPEFHTSIRMHGVYVPDTDPLWDIDIQAIEEFAAVPRFCEVEPCLCPHNSGRNHNAARGYCRLINCRMCGGNPAHYRCKSTPGRVYLCTACRPVEFRRNVTPVQQPNPESSTTGELRVVLQRLDVRNLRAAGVTHNYNLRSRKN